VAKLSVDQALLRARSHAKKGEIEEAQKLYQMVLQASIASSSLPFSCRALPMLI